jgi:Adenylate kinase and related kinases
MFNLVIFGAPGSGKGTQSERLINRYGLYHISTGDVLRSQIKEKTPLGVLADSFISDGKLVPDNVMIDILANELDTHKAEAAKGVIFDGFPRTVPQAVALKKLLEDRGEKVHAVIGLEVDEKELTKRLLERGKTSGRSDDNLETIQKRLDVYHQSTSPLKEYYIGEKKYHPIHGQGSIDEIFERVASTIDSVKD